MKDLSDKKRVALFDYVLRLGDDQLIIGHRLSEWCGHAPILEEDVALANLALDCIGQAEAFLTLAAELEGKGRTADDLAYFREAIEFRNLQLVELPRGDFGFTIARQFLFEAYLFLLYRELGESNYAPLAALAQKGIKEITYHLRHAGEWLIRLGDGTRESHLRAQRALDELWMYTGEIFDRDGVVDELLEGGLAPDPSLLQLKWLDLITSTITKATLTLPESGRYMISGARHGRHTEHLGRLLAEMQILQRSYPGAEW